MKKSQKLYSARRVILLVSVFLILIIFVLGGALAFLFHPKPPSDLFPALCSGKFGLANIPANTGTVPAPAPSRASDGELIGLSEGANVFDLQRSNHNEVQSKLQAAQDIVQDPQNVVLSLNDAISRDQTDAETQIYLENWKVLTSNHPHLTFVVGVNFAPTSSTWSSRDILQGAFTAQKECNAQNQQESKTQIVLVPFQI